MLSDLRNTAFWIVINNSINENSETQVQRHFNPMEYIQCPEFCTTPAVSIIGATSTEVNKETLLSEASVPTVRSCKSNVKGVRVEREVYHL